MENFNNNDTLANLNIEDNKLPQGLNILTILSIISSSITILSTFWTFVKAKDSYLTKDKTIEKMNSAEMPGFIKSIMPDTTHFDQMITKSYENRIPLLILGLTATVLCLVGALQMRKRKKQGYLLYVIGSLLPFLTSLLFIGTFALNGGGFWFGVGLTALFIALYSMQKKHLVH
ncbi:MAG: hypothetical protein ABL929_04415 [Ferruginibacter sp.]|nr:hypothetical protein [Ferruginibacter sp.]